MKKPNNFLSQDGDARYYPNFFSEKESDRLLTLLKNKIEWKHEAIFLFGKKVMQPRLTAWYGDTDRNYSYSGITMTPNPWTNFLIEIKEKIEFVSGVKFNSALLNQYRNENDGVGWHRDNEKTLGLNPVIASVSFGAPRKFYFRHCHDKRLKTYIDLDHGSLLMMSGETQHHWQHSIPKLKIPASARINITFRIIKDNRLTEEP